MHRGRKNVIQVFVDVAGMLAINTNQIAEFFIIAFNYLPYWSHDRYFSSGNEDRFMSYMSLTVKNLADLITVPQKSFTIP